MKKAINNIKNNQFFRFFYKLFKIMVWVFIIFIVGVILIQRIFNNDVSIGSYRMFNVVSGSMKPTYDIFDVIVAKEVPINEIKVGDHLVYLGTKEDFKDKIVTHSVIDVIHEGKNISFKTKGLANNYEDPIVESNQVYGIVCYKTILLSFLSHVLNNSYGFYFLIFVPITLLIFFEIIDYIKKKEEELEETIDNTKTKSNKSEDEKVEEL